VLTLQGAEGSAEVRRGAPRTSRSRTRRLRELVWSAMSLGSPCRGGSRAGTVGAGAALTTAADWR